MYTSDPLHKKLWAKGEGAGDAATAPAASAASTQHLTPLRRSERNHAAHTSPARGAAPTPRSPLPPVWGNSATASPELEETTPTPGRASARTTVMDPLAALRQCLQYVCSHPEVYGDDIRGLLDREVMHVVRLKASEVSLIQGQRPLLVDPLDSTSIRQSTRPFAGPGALPSISASSSTTTMSLSPPPYSSTNGATAPGTTRSGGGGSGAPATSTAASYADCVSVGDLFGYGSVSFLPANSAGFSALLRDTRAQATGNHLKQFSGREEPGSPVQRPLLTAANATHPLDETIQWNGTLPPSSLHAAAAAAAAGGGSEANNAHDGRALAGDFKDAVVLHEGRDGLPSPSTTDYALADPYGDLQRPGDAELFRQVDEPMGPGYATFGTTTHRRSGKLAVTTVAGDTSSRNNNNSNNGIVLDHHGYEVTYLRTQLQQLEAAFNAKCVRLHELESENKLFAEQMRASEEAAARWSAEHHAMEGKLEVLRRELDGWKDRANDALAAATKQNKQRSQHAKQLASNQINDAKQEAARVSQLWRETERALQESRRAFENTEKEASAAHNHLADAFHYLERLERRVARRDAYVQLCERRHRSLEEKYEKLMWGYEELSTIEGRYSYVDYLLTTRPLWSVYLFLALAQHRGDYVVMEDQGELKQRVALMAAPFTTPGGDAGESTATAPAAPAEVMEPQSWLLFARTPHGGCYAGACYDPLLVVRLIVSEVTAEVLRRGRAKQLRTNLHGSVACRVLRWCEPYAIDYLGGQDSFPDSGDLNRKFVPVLTLASVLLPLRSRSGAMLLTDTTTPATASTTNAAAASLGAPGGKTSTPGSTAGATTAASSSTAAPLPNTRRYDEATIRFVLRCFWKERLAAFARQMEVRVEAFEAKRQRLERQRALRHPQTRVTDVDVPTALRTVEGLALSDNEDGAGHAADEDEEEQEEEEAEGEELAENAPVIATFLTALVDFVTRFTKLATNSGGSAASSAPPGVADVEAAMLSSASAPPTTSSTAAAVAAMAPDPSTLLRVRGVLARGISAKSGGSNVNKSTSASAAASVSPGDAALWECGRVFFAVILQPSPAAHPSTATATGAGATVASASAMNNTAGVANPTSMNAAADSSKLNGSEVANEAEVAALADDVRELLAALYYYTMEYKSQEPDFRLFYLVSHQLIPEMVAVNFFASLESFQRECAGMLEKRIHFLADEDTEAADTTRDGRVSLAPTVALDVEAAEAAAEAAAEVDDPLTSLTKTVQMIDDAPLDGQDDEIEPDSDGEGYGSILPFRARAAVHERSSSPPAAVLAAVSSPPSNGEAADGASESGRKSSAASSRGTQRRAGELKLLHNIRTYLKERHLVGLPEAAGAASASAGHPNGPLGDSQDVDGAEWTSSSGVGASPTTNQLSAFAFGDAAADWSNLEEAVLQRLAPHTALLDAFRARCGPKVADFGAVSFTSMASRSTASATFAVGKEDRGYLRRKHDDRKVRHEVTKCLSATRGLLTLDDVLALLQRHCFATYAVSCCGTPRFSLADALMKGSAASRASISSAAADLAVAGGAAGGPLQPYAVVGYVPPTGLQLQRLRFALSLDQPSHLVDVAQLFTVDPATKANRHLYNTYLTLTLDLFQQQQSFLMQSVLTSCAERHEKYAAEGAEDCDGQVPIASLRKGMTSALAAVHGSAQHATALVNHLVQYDELLRLEDEVKLEQFADAPLLLNIPAGPARLNSTIGRDNSFHYSRHQNNNNNTKNVSSSNANNATSYTNNNSSYRSGNDGASSTATRRRSEANSVMEEVEDAEFNLREEAESCSLLHIAFAVRMTYIVWGRLCADTAAAVVRRVVQRPVPTARSLADDAGGHHHATAVKVAELPEWDVFERQVQRQYTLALARLRDGHNGDDNPLRRTLRGEHMKALGMSSVLPYNARESAARKFARSAAAAAASASASAAVSVQDNTIDDDAPPLYPDMARVFYASDAPRTENGVNTVAPTTTTATAAAGGTSVSTGEKTRKRASAVAGRTASLSHITASVSKRPSTVPLAADADAAKRSNVAARPPDYGLISLSRALGFVSPVTAPSAAGTGAGGAGGGLGASSKKAAGKRAAAKKPAAKKAVTGAEAGGISSAAQEEYSRALSTQLQAFATRIARLIQSSQPLASDPAADDDRPGSAGGFSAMTSTTTPPTAIVSEPVRTITFPNMEVEGPPASTSAARATTRTRSVAFVQEARGGRGLEDSRRSTMNGNGDGAGGDGARPLLWRPVFANEARDAEVDGHANTVGPNAILDVSKLYAACAALSIL